MKILKINDVPRCAARAQGVFQQPVRSLADDIESGKIEVKESKVTVEFDKDPDVQTLKLTTKKV